MILAAGPGSKDSAANGPKQAEGRSKMLWTIFAVLMILWILGMLTHVTAGGLIHILLLIAIIVVLVRVIQGRRPI
jgi:hypothetical protein